MAARRSTKEWALTWSVSTIASALQRQQQVLAGIDRRVVERALTSTSGPYGTDERSVLTSLLAADQAAQALDQARVVLVDPEQVTVLPDLDDSDEIALAQQAHAPFPVTYFDFAGASGTGIDAVSASDFDGQPARSRLVGAMVLSERDTLRVLPVLKHPDALPDGMDVNIPAVVTFPRDGQPPRAKSRFEVVRLTDTKSLVPSVAGDDPEFLRVLESAVAFAEPALKVLMLLESANVLVEPRRLGPRNLRRVEQGERRPPYVIAIQQRQIAASPESSSTDPGRRLSVRFEVRGFYRHYGPDTPIGRSSADKLREVPGRGRCVRVWTPPHVRGPADQPLTIRVRKLL